jgi:hypothetical protein
MVEVMEMVEVVEMEVVEVLMLVEECLHYIHYIHSANSSVHVPCFQKRSCAGAPTKSHWSAKSVMRFLLPEQRTESMWNMRTLREEGQGQV